MRGRVQVDLAMATMSGPNDFNAAARTNPAMLRSGEIMPTTLWAAPKKSMVNTDNISAIQVQTVLPTPNSSKPLSRIKSSYTFLPTSPTQRAGR